MSTGADITLKELQLAALGNFNASQAARIASAKSPQQTTSDNAIEQALSRVSGDPKFSNNRNAVTEFNPQNMTTTPMLGQAQFDLGIGQRYPSNMGLSSKGKYSGFYTASDRHNAVLGQAIQSKDRLSSQLRDLANARYEQVDSVYFPADNQNLDQYSTAFRSRMMPGTAQQAEGVPKVLAKPGASDVYDQRDIALKNWYAKNIAPANEANASANANDLTPLSTYAAAIASRNYNINPYAAAGEFHNADSEMYRGTRDQASMQDYGMGYDELKELNSQYEEEATDNYGKELDANFFSDRDKNLNATYAANLENLTGMDISALKRQTGSTEAHLYNTLFSKEGFSITIPGTNQIAKDAKTVFSVIKKNMMTEGKYEDAVAIVKQVQESNPALAQILANYVAAYSKQAKTSFENLYDPTDYMP